MHGGSADRNFNSVGSTGLSSSNSIELKKRTTISSQQFGVPSSNQDRVDRLLIPTLSQMTISPDPPRWTMIGSSSSTQHMIPTQSTMTVPGKSVQPMIPTLSSQSTISSTKPIIPTLSSQSTISSTKPMIPTLSTYSTMTASTKPTIPTLSSQSTMTAPMNFTMSSSSMQPMIPTLSMQTTPAPTNFTTSVSSLSMQPMIPTLSMSASSSSTQPIIPTLSMQTTTSAPMNFTMSSSSMQPIIPTLSTQSTTSAPMNFTMSSSSMQPIIPTLSTQSTIPASSQNLSYSTIPAPVKFDQPTIPAPFRPVIQFTQSSSKSNTIAPLNFINPQKSTATQSKQEVLFPPDQLTTGKSSIQSKPNILFPQMSSGVGSITFPPHATKIVTASQALYPSVSQALYPSASQALYPSASQALYPSASQALYPSVSQALYPSVSQALYPSVSQALYPSVSQALYPSVSQALYPSVSQALYPSVSQALYPSVSEHIKFPLNMITETMIPLYHPQNFTEPSLLASPLTASQKAAVNNTLMEDGREIDIDRISADSVGGRKYNNGKKFYSLAELQYFGSRLGLKMDNKNVLVKRILERLKAKTERQQL